MTPATENQFTGQKLDGTGLYYDNARYYDPALGQFVSPDTLVPDASRVGDYNRYLYARGNPLRYNDPSGHTPGGPQIDGGICVVMGCNVDQWSSRDQMEVSAPTRQQIHVALDTTGFVDPTPLSDGTNAILYAS